MSKEFKKLGKMVSQIENEIKAVEGRIAEIEVQRGGTAQKIDQLTGQLEAALVADDSAKVVSLEKEILKFRGLENRDLILTPALQKKVDQLNVDFTQARQNLDLRFSELAGRWLETEAKLYDDAAKVLILQLHRLFACSELLREKDFSGTWREIVGPGHAALNQIKIPILKGFVMSEFNQPGRLLTFSQDDADKVHGEIIK